MVNIRTSVLNKLKALIFLMPFLFVCITHVFFISKQTDNFSKQQTLSISLKNNNITCKSCIKRSNKLRSSINVDLPKIHFCTMLPRLYLSTKVPVLINYCYLSNHFKNLATLYVLKI